MTDHDLQRIAFVTRRFHELQGLKAVAVGTGLLFGVLLWSCAEGRPQDLTYFLHQGTVWGFLLGISVVDRHYRAAGAVVTQRKSSRGSIAPLLLPLYLAIFADVWVNNPLMYGIPPPAAMPNLAAVAITGTAVWILLRDGVRRAHYAIALAVGAVVLLAGLPPSISTGPYSPDPARAHVLAFGYALIGLAVIAVGLMDHRQLRLALTVRPGTQEGDEPVDTASPAGGPARLTAGFLLFISASAYSFAGWDHPTALSLLLSLACFSVLGLHYSATVLDPKAAHRQGHWRFPAGLRPDRRAPPDLVSEVLLPLTVAAGVVLDMVARGAGVPSVAALAFCCWRLWLARRDGRRGVHHLAGAVTGLIVSVAYMRVSTPAEALSWLTLALCLLGITLMLGGFVDWRRERAFRPSPGESQI